MLQIRVPYWAFPPSVDPAIGFGDDLFDFVAAEGTHRRGAHVAPGGELEGGGGGRLVVRELGDRDEVVGGKRLVEVHKKLMNP